MMNCHFFRYILLGLTPVSEWIGALQGGLDHQIFLLHLKTPQTINRASVETY